MPGPDPESRKLIAQIASAERWGRETDRTSATAPARAGLRAKFARQVDPDGTLAASDPGELERRVQQLHRAHMLRMTLAARETRRKAREAAQAAEAAETALREAADA